MNFAKRVCSNGSEFPVSNHFVIVLPQLKCIFIMVLFHLFFLVVIVIACACFFFVVNRKHLSIFFFFFFFKFRNLPIYLRLGYL